MTVPYQQVLSRKASPFMRWCLSPFLLIFAVVFVNPLFDSIEEHHQIGVAVSSLLILLCLAGFLALWGVPFVGRIASGIVSLAFGWYLVEECIIHFDGSWGWGSKRSETTPINSILGFLVFGLPCLIYTIFGRFTIRKESESESEDEFDECDHDNDDEINQDAPRD